MPQIFCIIDDGGRTLVTKAQGDISVPSFPTVGLLCSISTYSDSAGFSVETFGTTNVQIIYKRFANHLLFVLATSNLLAHPQQLQNLLQVIYDGLVMLLGPSALQIDAPGRLDILRKKLRGLTLLDALIIDDALVPCVMLQAPQVMGLPLHERQALLTALVKIADAASTGLSALVGEGWYLAATPEWWMMQPHEVLLLQHIATFAAESDELSMDVYLSINKYRVPFTFNRLTLDQGLHLLLMCNKDADMDLVQPTIEQQATRVQPILQLPAWGMPPVPQFSALTFDMCMLVQHAPSQRITLLWGHTSEVPVGFNPLMSPTLKRQLASSAGGASMTGSAASFRSVSLSQKDPGNSDSQQLYYRSCVDMLVSFMLQQQHPPGHGSSQRGAPPPSAGGGLQRGVGGAEGAVASPLRFNQQQGFMWRAQVGSNLSLSPSGLNSDVVPSAAEEEVHLVTAGNRLVALTDSSPHGMDVYAVFPRRISRLDGRDCAQRLRSVFQMSYNEVVL